MFVVTILLIFKELRIWQFKHSERMNIMGLFGAPAWLRSAVLFRLAIVDALIASLLSFGTFVYLSSHSWVLKQFDNNNVKLEYFEIVDMKSLQPIEEGSQSNHIVACIAAYVENVRLIDNIILFS